MAALTITPVECAPSLGQKIFTFTTAATADTGDTIAFNMANYGCTSFLGILGMNHTTANSVVVTEAPTTAVSGTTLTITIGGSASSDHVRSYLCWFA